MARGSSPLIAPALAGSVCLQELLSRVAVEQAGVADVEAEHLQRLVAADLADLPDVGARAGGGGHEARAQGVPGVAGGIEPGRGGAGLDDAGDRVVGEPGFPAHAPAALPQGAEQGPLLDRRRREPGPEVGDGAEPAPFGDGNDLAFGLLIGL